MVVQTHLIGRVGCRSSVLPCAVSVAITVATDCHFSVGRKVLIEWNGQWWLGLILEINDDMYRITYEDYTADWDEWVDDSRLKSV